MLNDTGDSENRLRRAIEEDCRRVRMLDTLSEEDKNGKYKNAISELMDRLCRNGTEYLSMVVYDRFLVPASDAFHEAFYDE